MEIAFKRLFQQCKNSWTSTKPHCDLTYFMIDEKQREKNECKLRQMLQLADNSDDIQEDMITAWMKEDEILKLKLLSEEQRDGFWKVTRQFVKDARDFDPDISEEDIGQAMRNVWIFIMLEVLLKRPIHYHKAIFAYSMLYPYTDNLLDDTSIICTEKQQFNQRLSDRLHGVPYASMSIYEEKIDRLISFIEDKFERKTYPSVYESLLCIQKGQELSVLQQKNEASSLLDISIIKGGSSVLADGFLIDGKLSEQEQLFCMKYGFFLQLSDDLQDMVEDFQHQHQTLLSIQEGNKEQVVKQLLHFTMDTMRDPVMDFDIYKDIVEYDCILLILVAIMQHRTYFSDELLSDIIPCLPVSLPFIDYLKHDMAKKPQMDMKANYINIKCFL